MTDQTYAGWPNYETWSVNLLRGELGQLIAATFVDDNVTIDVPLNEHQLVGKIAEVLEDNIRSEIDNLTAGMDHLPSQLLTHALSRVDWTNLAEHYLFDAHE